MENVYAKYKNLSRLSIKERVSAFRKVTLEEIAKGKSIETIRSTLEGFKDDEMYEAMKGVLSAIEDFKANPQTRLF